jgi:hypothetical protein
MTIFESFPPLKTSEQTYGQIGKKEIAQMLPVLTRNTVVRAMEINGVPIEDTFAEAFSMHMNRTIITAYDQEWAYTTATETTGFGTSVIMAPAEAGTATSSIRPMCSHKSNS